MKDRDGDKLAVFYKLFTDRPVIDLGAFSPRQYTHANTKLPTIVHSKNNTYHGVPEEETYIRSV